MKTARSVARTLKEHGVKRAFGVPGGEVTDLLEGFRAEGLDFVLTRHESAAAFMASATGTLTGIPGVCVSTLGPGATNMVTGVAQAYLDRAPLLAFTGQLPRWKTSRDTHQVLDLSALYRPITKWGYSLEPRNCAASVSKAVDVALAERPGPVHIEVPSDVGNKDCDDDSSISENGTTSRYLTQEPNQQGISAAAGLLLKSERPVLLVGMSAARARATEELVALADALPMPVIVTPHAKSVFPEDHECFVGVLEMLGTAYLFDVIASSDFVVAVGLDPVELMGTWPDKPGIYLDSVPNLDHYFTSSLEIVGPVRRSLGLLAGAVTAHGATPKWDLSDISRMKAHLDAIVPGGTSDKGMYPKNLFRAMNRVLPQDSIVSCDVGAHKFATGQLWRPTAPGTFLISNGLSSMGYGLPSAIAAKLVCPDRAVAAVLGDGGLAMYAGEMDTARRLGAAVIIVVCVDNALSLIKMNQARKGYPSYGSEFTNPDWAAVAAGMGLGSSSVTAEDEMADALRDALKSDGPYLIQAFVDPRGYDVTL